MTLRPSAKTILKISRFPQQELATPDDVYKLCDADYLVEAFGEDLALTTYLDAINEQLNSPQLEGRAASSSDVSQNKPIYFSHAREEAARRLEKPALFATRCVVEMIERFAVQTNKRLMFVLSFSFPSMVRELTGQVGYYQPFIDWLKQREYPVVDMRNAFQADLAKSRLSAAEYLQQYYNGHHTASGNFFTARAILPTLVDWLEPKPVPYRRQNLIPVVLDDGPQIVVSCPAPCQTSSTATSESKNPS